ncbi:MAG TPA: thioredoxin-like domain-containing protein [bacterium]
MTEQRQMIHAPEFPSGLTWYNTPAPLSLKALRGKIVLLDFWTYCCINCMHVLPDLKYLEEKFADAPFQVIGVHCPKFPNEKVDHHVRHAIMRYGIAHPVVVDSGFQIWQRFAVRAWPTLVVVDPMGYLVGVLPGEGHRKQIEDYVNQALPHYRAEGVVVEGGAAMVREHEATHRSPLLYPGKVAADASRGTLWIADTGHHRLVEVRPSGEVVRTVGNGVAGLKDGSGATANFREPQGMRVQGDVLYVADTGNHAIRSVDLKSGAVTTLAGTGEQSTHGAVGGPAKSTALNSPWDIAAADDQLYIAMAGPHQLWRLDLARGQVAVHAGSGREEIIDGPLPESALAQPSGIDVDGDAVVFADSEVSSLRRAGLSPLGQVQTLIGGGLFDFGDVDGARGTAKLQHPLGVLARNGHVLVADTYNHKVKLFDKQSGAIKTLAGSGTPGLADGPLGTAQFQEPSGLAWLGDRLYVADTNNHALRWIDLKAGAVGTVAVKS